jgi:hypothetical protein
MRSTLEQLSRWLPIWTLRSRNSTYWSAMADCWRGWSKANSSSRPGIDDSAAIATSKFDMEINGTAMVPSPDNPHFDLILSIKTSTKTTIEESSSPQP